VQAKGFEQHTLQEDSKETEAFWLLKHNLGGEVLIQQQLIIFKIITCV
jgi:hypothetical protein